MGNPLTPFFERGDPMNITVYKALNTLAGSNTTLTANLATIGAAITAKDANFNGTNIQGIWTALQGGLDSWYCNETHQGDGLYATTYNALALTTNVTVTRTPEYKYVNANTAIPS